MKWQPIETAPKDGTHILVYAQDDYSVPFVSWWGCDRYEKGEIPSLLGCGDVDIERHWCVSGCEDGDSTICEPTHWMPLPGPPKE